MSVNMQLAKERGLSEHEVDLLNQLHTLFDEVSVSGHLYPHDEWVETMHKLEYAMQDVWGFENDFVYHSRTELALFRSKWAGTKVQCTKTGEVFIIPEDVKYKQFFKVGEGFIDVGDDHYYRGGGVVLLEKGDTE